MNQVPFPKSKSKPLSEWTEADLGQLLATLGRLRFGSVEIFVQDGHVVQIDRKEKFRFGKT